MDNERMPGGIAVPDERLAVHYTKQVPVEVVWSGHPDMIGYFAFKAGQVFRVKSTELDAGGHEPIATVTFIEVL
jgi:hypothetical protein